MTGLTLKDSAGWVSHYLGCDNVLIDGVTIASRVNGNNDGIDVDSCTRVRIANCEIDTGDDAICIKSTRSTPSENIVVTNCTISSYVVPPSRSVQGSMITRLDSPGELIL